MYILGISAYHHDSAAVIIKNEEILAAVQEERFTRVSCDNSLPINSINYCLKEAAISLSDLSCVVFYDKPILKFERMLESYVHFSPLGFKSFLKEVPLWMKDKLFVKTKIKKELKLLSNLNKKSLPKLLFSEHHQSHAASAFYPSPFESAAVLCIDGVGEWATTTAWHGKKSSLNQLWEINFPHSISLFYSTLSNFIGFDFSNPAEFKLMELAPYGTAKYKKFIFDHLVDIKKDGTFHLNMNYFNFSLESKSTNDALEKLFGRKKRIPRSKITQSDMDIAASVQLVVEEIVLKLAQSIRQETGERNLCLSGDIALNSAVIGSLYKSEVFDNIWVQPAANDSGGALGAAYAALYQYFGLERSAHINKKDQMKGAYLGPIISTESAKNFLTIINAKYIEKDESELMEYVSELLAAEKVVGWITGRAEFGSHALGARSILADPRSKRVHFLLNTKIKYRESFRPHAAAILFEEAYNYFKIKPNDESPYMLFRTELRENMMNQSSIHEMTSVEGSNSKLAVPGATHVDFTSRVQTVHRETNPRFHSLIKKFQEKTGCPLLINSPFSFRGEPLVHTVLDIYNCFMRTQMDYLVIQNLILDKKDQNPDFSFFYKYTDHGQIEK